MAQTLTKGPITHLVVGLQEVNKGSGRKMPARFPAPYAISKVRGFSLEDKAFGQAATQKAHRIGGVIVVATLCFAACKHM